MVSNACRDHGACPITDRIKAMPLQIDVGSKWPPLERRDHTQLLRREMHVEQYAPNAWARWLPAERQEAFVRANAQ